MINKRFGALVAGLAAAAVLAVPSTSSASDLGDTCEAVLGGSDSDSLNLVVVNVNYDTCKNAEAPTCDSGTPIGADLAPLVRVRLTVCG